MQTQLMQPAQPGVPWLERYVDQGGAPERTPIQSLPFTIGRVDTTDLQVNSTRVSREHAVIVREGDDYLLRDLGSTNGTFVNGKRIAEVTLSDGDLVVIADCEFTFNAGVRPASQRNCATQTMAELMAPAAGDPHERVLALRRFQERLLHRGFLPRLNPILDLEQEAPFAFRAEVPDFSDVAASAPRLIVRANQLYRLLAAEAFLNLDEQAKLVVDISRADFEVAPATRAHLLRLNHIVGHGRLIIGMPATLITDDPRARQWREAWETAGVPVAYVSFLGGRTQIEQMVNCPPDYLVLDGKATNEVASSPRQSRQLATVAEACKSIGCQAIVTGLKTREDEEACLKLGLRLAASDRLAPAASKSLGTCVVSAADERVECLA